MLEGKKTLSDYAPRIINIGSMSAYTASVNRGEYCISKAGVGMVTKLFAARLASEGIPVFEVRPGIIDTDMTKGVHEKYRKLIDEGLLPVQRFGEPRMSQEWFWRAAPDCWIIRRGRALGRGRRLFAEEAVSMREIVCKNGSCRLRLCGLERRRLACRAGRRSLADYGGHEQRNVAQHRQLTSRPIISCRLRGMKGTA